MKDIKFAIIRQRGSPNEATTLDGYKVRRESKIYIPEWGTFVVCAPYDNHFVYIDPSGIKNRWFAMCTCGSAAVIVGYDGYKQDASKNSSPMLICKMHADTGLHQTDTTKWK